MTAYYAGGIKLEFPANLFDPMDRETVEHVIRCYLEEDKTFQGATPADQTAFIEGFLDQIKPKGSCWSIV